MKDDCYSLDFFSSETLYFVSIQMLLTMHILIEFVTDLCVGCPSKLVKNGVPHNQILTGWYQINEQPQILFSDLFLSKLIDSY